MAGAWSAVSGVIMKPYVLILQSLRALPSSPGSPTRLIIEFTIASSLATLTLSVGNIDGGRGPDAGTSAVIGGLASGVWVESAREFLGGGEPVRVYGTQSSGTLRATQCWHGVSRLHFCLRLAHSAHDSATRRFFFFCGASSEGELTVCFPVPPGESCETLSRRLAEGGECGRLSSANPAG